MAVDVVYLTRIDDERLVLRQDYFISLETRGKTHVYAKMLGGDGQIYELACRGTLEEVMAGMAGLSGAPGAPKEQQPGPTLILREPGIYSLGEARKVEVFISSAYVVKFLDKDAEQIGMALPIRGGDRKYLGRVLDVPEAALWAHVTLV